MLRRREAVLGEEGGCTGGGRHSGWVISEGRKDRGMDAVVREYIETCVFQTQWLHLRNILEGFLDVEYFPVNS